PDAAHEALRDLERAREDAKQDQLRTRHRVRTPAAIPFSGAPSPKRAMPICGGGFAKSLRGFTRLAFPATFVSDSQRFGMSPMDRTSPSGSANGPYDPDAGDLLPLLHGNYPVSPLLRSSPPLAGPSVLSASRFPRLGLFPFHRQPGSQVPYK